MDKTVPLIPMAVTPWLTAFKAYSIHNEQLHHSKQKMTWELPICTSFPLPQRQQTFISRLTRELTYLGENVVKENE